jgi:short-subunit dehydrogenase
LIELRGATALVTGAAGGLGGYITQALAGEGANLVLSDLPQSDLTARAAELQAMGVRVEVVPADLAEPEARQKLIADAESALGPIDILVNNAGLEFGGPFTEGTAEEISLISRVNLEAVMDLTLSALPGMLERRRGHVVNIASMAGKLPSPYLATYAATKHGVVGFTHSLRLEYGSSPVGISAICPIFISRVGMYGRLEHLVGEPPPEMQTMPPEAVGAAVLGAIRDNKAEVLVTRGPTKPLIGLYALSPGGVISLFRRRRRVFEFAREFTSAREKAGG